MTTIENNEKRITLRMVIKYFVKKSMKYKWFVLMNIIGMLLISLVGIYSPLYLTKFVDIFAMTGVEKSELINMALKILIIVMSLEVVYFIGRRLLGVPTFKHELGAMKDIYEECFLFIHKHSYRFFTNNLSGSLIKKITKLAGAYETIADNFIYQILRIVIFIPLAIVILFKENILLGAIFIVFIIFYVILQIIFFNVGKKYEIVSNERDSKATGELSDTIINNYNISIFSTLGYEFKRFSKTLGEAMRFKGKKWGIDELSFAVCGALSGVFTFLALYISLRAWGNGLIQASVVILVQMYLVKITGELSSVRYILKAFSNALGESKEMLEILNTPHEIQDHTNKKLKIGHGKIDFENVTFNYIDGKNVFDGLNLNIKPGEKVAIVGASGSGKTTLIKLLFRFFDIQGGRILIDGQDISQVTQDSLREQLSMVPQDPILFHRTIRENIGYGRQNATEQEIIAAAKMAKCHDFISNLKDGYESFVGERGIKLSGGERQRIAIARAILENKNILVMDEATSSLDSESEKYIQDAMDEVMKNKTCIVIAHRLSTIAKMDKIIVMDNGNIVEKGSHNVLIQNKDGIYHKLWSIQSGGFLTDENL